MFDRIGGAARGVAPQQQVKLIETLAQSQRAGRVVEQSRSGVGQGLRGALFLDQFRHDEFAAQAAAGKIGTLAGSLLSALLGAAILFVSLPRAQVTPAK